MEIRQIKYFIQIYKDKSFSKAAENLHISQQGLSRIIKNLEAELEISLFDRSSKGVKPTEFGNLLLERSQKIVNEFDLMVDSLYDKGKLEKGTISIGLSHILYTSIFAAIISEFHEKYPHIKLEIFELGDYESEKKIEDDLLDICFTVKPVNTEKFQFIPVCSYDMMLLVNKDNSLAEKSGVKFKDLENDKFIMLSSEYKSRHLTIERCLQSGYKPKIVFTTSLLDLIIELVDLNKGIAILPEFISLRAAKISDKVSAVSFQDKPIKIEMGFIINRYRSLNYIINILINYALKFYENNKE